MGHDCTVLYILVTELVNAKTLWDMKRTKMLLVHTPMAFTGIWLYSLQCHMSVTEMPTVYNSAQNILEFNKVLEQVRHPTCKMKLDI